MDTLTIEDIAKMSVQDAKTTLPGLTDDQLIELTKLETKDGEEEGRVTLVAAIEAEQHRRQHDAAFHADRAGAGDQDGAPNHPAAPTDGRDAEYWNDQFQQASRVAQERGNALTAIGEAIGGEAYDDLANGVVVIDRVVDLAIARLAELRDQREEAAQLRAKVAELEQKAALGEAPIGAPIADHTHVTQRGSGGFELVLMDGERDVAALPGLPVLQSDFHQRSADTVIYQRPIVIPPLVAGFRLTAVELRDPQGRPVDRCAMLPAMEAGGGKSVELPAGTLIFRQPAVAAAEAAAIA